MCFVSSSSSCMTWHWVSKNIYSSSNPCLSPISPHWLVFMQLLESSQNTRNISLDTPAQVMEMNHRCSPSPIPSRNWDLELAIWEGETLSALFHLFLDSILYSPSSSFKIHGSYFHAFHVGLEGSKCWRVHLLSGVGTGKYMHPTNTHGHFFHTSV